MSLPQNEHPIDRAARVLVGLILAGVALAGGLTSPLVYVIWLVAAIALVTGIAGFCPLYAVLGIRTRRAV